MSNNLTLIKYQLDIGGRYLEDTGEVIASSFIGEDVLDDLIKVAPLAKLTIYEEVGSDESSEADCLQNEKIPEILDFVKNKFVDFFKKTEVSALEKSDEKLIEAMSTVRSITNLYFLLETKYIKYKSDDTVVVKLG